jgi:hypothetical protein
MRSFPSDGPGRRSILQLWCQDHPGMSRFGYHHNCKIDAVCAEASGRGGKISDALRVS